MPCSFASANHEFLPATVAASDGYSGRLGKPPTTADYRVPTDGNQGLVEELGVKFDNRGNVAVDRWMTSVPGVFAAGDTLRGASLVVHAINQGWLAAAVDRWLKGN
jgi:thioredoxin reductase